jgi:hypothetical protein
LARNYVQSTYGINIENFHSNVFDVNATTPDEGQGWAGVYWGGTNDFALQSDIATNWGRIVMDHELGHRVGADHANAWRNLNNSDYTSYVWNTTVGAYQQYSVATHGWQPLTFGVHRDEYGNPFDTMGNISHGDFRIREKVEDLGWLTNAQVPSLNSLGAGTYRIYAHDELAVAIDPGDPLVAGDETYGVQSTYAAGVYYGLTYTRTGEQFDSSSGAWGSDSQRIDIEYRVGRDGVQFYLDGGILDLDSEGGTNRNNQERELELGRTIADVDINRSQFFASDPDIDFLSFNPPAPTNWRESLTEWFEFSVLNIGRDAIGAYAELSVTIARLLNDIAGDINQDGFLDELDIQIFAANWRRDTSLLAPFDQFLVGDLTQNGVVDFEDFWVLRQAFSAANLAVPSLGSLVPEPTGLMLLAVMLAAAGCRRLVGRTS